MEVDVRIRGPGSSSGKELGYGLDSPTSIPGVGGAEIFLLSFVSWGPLSLLLNEYLQCRGCVYVGSLHPHHPWIFMTSNGDTFIC